MPLRFAALLLLLPALCAQAQYKWTDANGGVGYGDQPPRDAKHVERIDAAAGAPASADELAVLPFEVRRAAKNFPVILYATVRPDCAPCASARSFLQSHGVPYAERTVDTSRDVAAFETLGGGSRVPALAVGRGLLRGFEPGAWSDALANAGYPQDVTLPSSWHWPAPAPLAPPEAAPAAPAPTGERP